MAIILATRERDSVALIVFGLRSYRENVAVCEYA
jgi:hypothetical protein